MRQVLEKGEYVDTEIVFLSKMPKVAECLTLGTPNDWTYKSVNGWYCTLTRDDDLEIGVRLHYEKLEISGNYEEYNLYGDRAAQNEIGSALTTNPHIIAKGIIKRLLPFVEKQTEEVTKILAARKKYDEEMEKICDRMVRASGGKRKINNLSSDKLYIVEQQYNPIYGTIDFEAKVWGTNDHNIKIKIDHLSELQAYEILSLLKTLVEEQDVQNAQEAEREGD